MKTRIKELRDSKNLSQTALSLIAHCSQNNISQIENETTVPRADVLVSIADYFHTSVDYILLRNTCINYINYPPQTKSVLLLL